MKTEIKYSAMPDEEIVSLIQAGDNQAMEYLFEKYKHMVRNKAKALFLIGGDKDDLIQEGMIGLYKAIRDFQKDKQSSFFNLRICAYRDKFTVRSKPPTGKRTFR
jgi:RNA polymerase, sigma 30 subunit, SigH